MLLPLEIMINKYYIKKAHKKLVTMPNLTKIAITGSYAKTTNKFVLEKMLQKKYNVLISPHSYNTPLGLSKVILSDLNSNHQIFIAEMGAKKVGEIAELCTMIQPNHAILTGIGTQHLETFKTEQNIIDTKNELALYVAQNQGITVYNGQNQKCIDLWQSSQNPNKILAGAENNFAFAKTTFVDKNGLKFELTIDGKTTTCKTSLLGEYNLQNICMCAALAYKLGVKLQQIKQAISELKPAEHRMQIIDSGSNIVIDDSFNASIEGCAVALSTIALFDDKTKVIITPGIVEMGKHETMTNFELGQKIAQHCDIAILVNEVNREAMLDGLRQQNFDETKIFCVDDLEQARAKIVELSLHNSVILFENDLPDIFELN